MKKPLLLFAPTGIILICLYLLSQSISVSSLEEMIHHAGIFAPLVYILLTLITYIIAPISGIPFLYAGYYVFGKEAIMYTQIATFLSFITNYWIGRILGKPFVDLLLGDDMREKLDRFLHTYGHISLYITRVLLGNFHDYLSYVAGLAHMQFRHYLAVSTIALLQETLLWYILSRHIESAWAFTLWTASIGIVSAWIFFLGTYITKRVRKETHLHHMI